VSKPIDPTALAAALAAVTGHTGTLPPAPAPTAVEVGDVLDPMPVVMGRIGGDPGLLARLAPALIADVARLRAKATDAAGRGDRAGVAAAAHALAGLVGLVSTRGHRAARALESAAHDGRDFASELAEVVRIADALTVALANPAYAPR
jgi:HPt (histidine-containing phosphotransfer) domain-containing protein